MNEIVIVGSGLSAYFFLKGLDTKNKNILQIDYLNYTPVTKNINNTKFQQTTLRFNKDNINQIVNFLDKNNFILNKNCTITGILNQGGVSNFWGLSCEFPKTKNINYLNQNNRDKLIHSFKEIYQTYNFEGFTENEEIPHNTKKIDEIYERIIKINNNNINFYKNCSAIDNKKCNKKNDNCWIKCRNSSTFIPNNLEKIEIKKANLYLEKIENKKNYYKLLCKDQSNQTHIINTKKLVLATGTIASTKLIIEMLNLNQEIKIYHNPMLFGCFLTKQKTIQNLNHWLAQIGSTNISQNSITRANYRSSNDLIKNTILKKNIFYNNIFFKKIYNLLEKNLIFINLYLNTDYSNLYIKKINNKFNIFSKQNNLNKIKKELKTNFKNIYNVLVENNIIYPFKLCEIPLMGHDNHFTGTIPINGKDTKLSVNENCELNSSKNLFIIDGSVIPKNDSYFPTGLIISNAYRIGKNFENF